MSGTFFNPSNPRYRRAVGVFAVLFCSGATFQVVMADFGSQYHIFTPIQKLLNDKIDKFYDVKPNELDITIDDESNKEKKDSWIKIRRVDVKK